MRIVDIQARLRELAASTGITELADLAQQLKRRRPARRAATQSAPMSDELRRQIISHAGSHPDWPMHKIGQHFNVNQGRVSEALRGRRG